MKQYNETVQQITEMAYGLGKGATPITKNQLFDVLKDAEGKGAVPFSITQVTKQASRKAPYPKFTLPGLKKGDTYFAKISQVNGMTGIDYAANVNTQREKEGLDPNFKAEKGWGTPITKSIYELDGQYYFYYRPMRVRAEFPPVYVVADDEQASSFTIVDSTIVDEYKPAEYKSAKQGVEEEIAIRKISFDGIAGIKIGGFEYIVTDLDSIRKKIFDEIQPEA